ncbi:hypothetical protein [Streptomyces sp. MMBL 11-3]|uniref:hypothetical protein n=1 Tax=Streptomyces sp. MMBL 11-3 TaxID=3382639 RepID=UPI0039B38DD3
MADLSGPRPEDRADFAAVPHAPAGKPVPRRPGAAGPAAALLVLTPAVAASSAVLLLVLGYLLRGAGLTGTLSGSLMSAGWVLALVAVLGAAVALGVRRRTAAAPRPPALPPGPD